MAKSSGGIDMENQEWTWKTLLKANKKIKEQEKMIAVLVAAIKILLKKKHETKET